MGTWVRGPSAYNFPSTATAIIRVQADGLHQRITTPTYLPAHYTHGQQHLSRVEREAVLAVLLCLETNTRPWPIQRQSARRLWPRLLGFSSGFVMINLSLFLSLTGGTRQGDVTPLWTESAELCIGRHVITTFCIETFPRESLHQYVCYPTSLREQGGGWA